MSDTSLNPYESPRIADPPVQVDRESDGTLARPEVNGLSGTASIYRLAAAIVDEGAATLLFFVTAVSLATAGDLRGIPLLVGAGSWLAYFFVTEWVLAATPGKLLTGLCVRQTTGERCTVRQIAVRTLLRIVEVNPLICGLFPAGIVVNCTARRQRIGDLLARTVVVFKSRLRKIALEKRSS